MKKLKGSEDRISGLPDAVLSHILSYLPTRLSARTSILSKRWLHVWSLVPDLEMDDSWLWFDDDPDKELALLSSFSRCLDNIFNMHEADSLPKLTLKCSKFDDHRVSEWVMSAVRCKVKEFDLCIAKNYNVSVGSHFASRYLVNLKLGKNFYLDLPEEVHLPSLKKLHLDYIGFLVVESSHRLLSGCPVLEHLNIESCYMGKGKTFQIISSRLKFLSLKCWYECQVLVDAPNLEVLRYSCNMPERSSFKNLDSLNEAYIDVGMYNPTSDKKETFLQLLNIIANAKIITFTSRTLTVLYSFDRTTFPMFNGLTKLVVESQRYYVMLLPKLLERAPFLQDLVLKCGTSDYRSPDQFEWHDPIQVPRCLLDSLKSLEVWMINEESTNVRKVVKYLVENGKVLVKISTGNKKEELRVSKQSDKFIAGKVIISDC